MIADPRTRKFCENGDTFQGWIGHDVHFLFSTIKNGQDCCWVMTHKDDADIEESWQLPGKMEDVYRVIEGWDPMVKAVVEKTPSCGLYLRRYQFSIITNVTQSIGSSFTGIRYLAGSLIMGEQHC